MPKIWKSSPPASSPNGRMAWDMLSAEYTPRKIVELRYARSMDDGARCAEFNDGKMRDLDILVVRHEVANHREKRLAESAAH